MTKPDFADIITNRDIMIPSLAARKARTYVQKEVNKMEKVQGRYETMFIVDPSLGDEGIEAVVNKFSDLIAANGTVEKVEKWGTRQLAYAIDKKADGYYTLITFTSEPGFTPELERIFNITDGVMRSIVVRLDK